jgi:serine/threonine protein phosphatase PrpC
LLRVVEEAARSDTGLQRSANEDAYLSRSPLYAVADGMGGAQAGEIAARIATETLEQQPRDRGNAEESLARMASEANRRIFELARSDSSRAGMGTTLTGALVSDKEVSIVHVGDSRAYLFRDGNLRQLTRDHSLVEELRRQGQLTTEEAEEHPQRSVITRALGPEPEVDLDLHTHQARSGDVFLLCSDGLTGMVREDRLQEILEESSSLQQAVDTLVEEANRNGGRDNITVVAFRVGADDGATGEADVLSGDTITDLETDDVHAAVAEATAEGAVEEDPRSASPKPAARPFRPRRRRMAARPTRPRRQKKPRRPLRVAIVSAICIVVLGGLATAAILVERNVYFIGQDDRGLVTLYRGLPYELPAGIKLYRSQYVSSVPAGTLRPFERRRLLDHELRSRSDAAARIRSLETGR